MYQHDGSLVAGKLLVAHPQLLDPNFERTVVLMLEHSTDGAVGVVLNRPSALPVSNVLPDLPGLDPDLVFVGGPVTPEVAIGLGPDGGAAVLVDIETDEGREAVRRIYAGYAGWMSGQLEAELSEGAWFVVDVEPGDVFDAEPDELWNTVVKRQGPEIAVWATYPEDPVLN